MSHLAQEVAKFDEIKRRLIVEHPDLEDDETCLADTLEGLTDIDEIIVKCVHQIIENEAIVDSLKAVIKKLEERQNRYKERSAKTRDMVLDAMLETGKKKIAGTITVSVSSGRKGVVVTDEKLLPENFFQTTKKPQKSLIQKALVQGEAVPGATLINGKPSLRIQT